MRHPTTAPAGRRFVLSILALALGASSSALVAAESPWEPAIRAFEDADRRLPPLPGGVVFAGSSSIRLWDLERSFPGRDYINRGFGGSQIADALGLVERIILPYRPRAVVFYSGDNDIAAGKSPRAVLDDFRELTYKVHAALPETKTIAISIKPSLARWEKIDAIREANARLAEFASLDPRRAFVDVATPMLGADGRPRPELLAADGLHLSSAGYTLWTSLVAPQLLPEGPADWILHGGKVATLDAAFSIAEAIAFAGDRILRVGSDAEVLALKGPATRLVDLRGRAALPGLIDSHVHPLGACLFELDHEVPAMESIADVLEYVRGRARVVPENGSIWVEQVFITRLKERRYPTRAELDGAAPKHAVVFSTGPDAAVNSLALELSGIDRDFVVQGSGSVEKDPQTGEPTGILRGGAKRHLKGESSSRRAGAAEREERLAALFADYNSTGITAAADRNASPEALDLYARLHRAGRLKVRIAASHALDGGAEIGAALETLKRVAQHPLRRGDARLRIVGVKTFLDGGMLTGSAYMREPWGPSAIYGIRDPEYRGVRFISQEKLVVLARAAAESGLQFTAHAVGDGAVHALLDAYDEVHRALPIAATRPCLTHANFQSAEAIAMMARLGVVADIQPIWLRLDGKTLLEHFGERRLRYFQPLRSLFAAGVVAGGGSDHMQKIGSLRSVNPYNPFLGMWTAITRRPRGLEAPLHAEEALSREQAVRLYTSNNARLLFLEGRIGSLEAGKQADLIVLDRDLLTCPEEAIPETRVLMTFFDGALVHERSP